MNGYCTFPEAPRTGASPSGVVSRPLVLVVITPLQRFSLRILKLQPTRLRYLCTLSFNVTVFFFAMHYIVTDGNLLSFLLRCGTRPYERGTQ